MLEEKSIFDALLCVDWDPTWTPIGASDPTPNNALPRSGPISNSDYVAQPPEPLQSSVQVPRSVFPCWAELLSTTSIIETIQGNH